MAAPKLTPDQRRCLLQEYAAGVRLKVIGHKYGVSANYATVLAARRGIKRKTVTERRIKRITKQFVEKLMQEVNDV